MTATTPCRSHDKDRLYRKRREAGLTVHELAQRTGLSVGTISRAENGGGLRVKSLHAIAQGLGCEVSELMPPEERDAE